MSVESINGPSWRRSRTRIAPADLCLNAVLVIGLALRVRQFLFNRSFWLDEALLAGNIGDRGLIDLLTAPLQNGQSAPPLYLLMAKCSILLFGNHDWALRLPSFVASIVTLIFAYLLAKKLFSSLSARLLFLGLLSISPVLLFYAVEFKPYGMDAALAVLLLWALVARHERRGAAWLAVAGFLGLCGSLPFVFLAAPAALLLAYEYLAARRYAGLAGIALAWVAGAGLHLAYLAGAGTDRANMTQWWQRVSGFPPADGTLQEILEWYIRSFVAFTQLAFRTPGIAAPGFQPVFFNSGGIALALACLLLIAVACRRATAATWISAAAIVLCMIAAGLKLYPFSSRLIIGLLPPLFLLLASGVDVMHRANRIAAAVFATVLICVSLPLAWRVAVTPVEGTAVRSAMQEMARQSQPDEAIALGRGTSATYLYYQPMLPLKQTAVRFGDKGSISKLDDYVRKAKPKRLWVLIGHRPGSTAALLEGFNEVNPRAFDWRGPGTILLLYENPKPSKP